MSEGITENKKADSMPEIEIEPYMNEHGFLRLRDRESKRALRFQKAVKVEIDGGDNNEIQVATVTLYVDPRLFV